MRGFGRAAILVGTAAVLAGCELLSTASPIPDDQLPVGVRVVTPPARMRLEAGNQSTIPVVLTVNGSRRDLQPGDSIALGVTDLGPLPWSAALLTGSGRTLTEITVREGDDWRLRQADGAVTGHVDGGRVDLSCGQLYLVSPSFIGGPAPGPGEPGDCDP